MTKFENRDFVGKEIVLDGHSYKNCRFDSCTLVYSADISSTGEFMGNTIALNCQFHFRGAAGDTVNFMKAIYAMGLAGRETILKTFQHIAPDLKNLH